MLMSSRKALYIHWATTLPLLLLPFATSAALLSSVQDAVPSCVQDCLATFITRNFPACTSDDLECLCSRYGSDGYTLGEGAYACLYSSTGCPPTSRTNGTTQTGVFGVCAGQTDAVVATHKTIIATVAPTTSASLSTSATTAATTTTADSSPSSQITRNSSLQPSPSSFQPVMKMGNISLTMAQIAGITIAAAALLILGVGIITCLIFVKRNKRLHDMEDSKILLYPSPRLPPSRGEAFAVVQIPPPVRDPRGGAGGVGILPFRRDGMGSRDALVARGSPVFQQRFVPQRVQPQKEVQQQWPRYYPIMPDEIGVGSTANHQVPMASGGAAAPAQQSNAPSATGANAQQQTPSKRQSTVVIPPQQPQAAHISQQASLAVPPSSRNTKRDSHRNSSVKTTELRPTSAMTEFEEDSMSPFKANFAAPKPTTQFPFAGPQEGTSIPYFPAPPQVKPQSKSRRPSLSVTIPKFEITLPPPPKGPPPAVLQKPQNQAQQSLQRPALRRGQSQQEVRNEPRPLPILQGLNKDSIYSSNSAKASSQALPSESRNTLTLQTSHSSSTKSRADSRASLTSFESFESEDEPTPPKEDDKRLSTVPELHSPSARISYPKVPRSAGQAVARSPGKMTVSPEPSPKIPTSPPRPSTAGSTNTIGSKGIGNRLWKTEKSPQNSKPYPTWVAQPQASGHRSWGSGGSVQLSGTPPVSDGQQYGPLLLAPQQDGARQGTTPYQPYITQPYIPQKSYTPQPYTPQPTYTPQQQRTLQLVGTPPYETPGLSAPHTPEPQWVMQTPGMQTPPRGIAMPPPFSPYGVMPKLTPTRRGDELYLSVN
ncbi:hypothetical protein EJ08DRAFT_661396 [Tothia fuscella]|uniref:Extracellular membrane protein CFEM domain-containing protein n=1 Tax=Tothia fuscella TaxID=1048955 RepID=A0A9P4TXK3_9PEZI|nr:hypothetical protein EJ08DRAFT_661396 [Tothia fuscella]